MKSAEQMLPYLATAVVAVILTLVCVAWYVVDANETLKKAERLNEISVEATMAATTIETAFLALTEKTTYLSAVADVPARVRITDWWRHRFNRAEQTPDWAEGEILAMPPAQLAPPCEIPSAKATLGSRWGHHLNRADWPNKTVRKVPVSAMAFTPLSLAMKLATLPDPSRALRVHRSF